MIKSFLNKAATYAKFHSINTFNEIILCVGNEAADSDSIISSTCYSYFRQSQIDSLASSFTTTSKLYIPLIPIPRNDLNLRPDVGVLLKSVDLRMEDLICIDDSYMQTLYNSTKLKWILLDHNSISQSVTSVFYTASTLNLESYPVLEILDHHKDLGHHIKCNGAQRNIAFEPTSGKPLVGSACTLVYERIASEAPEMLDSQVATLLLGVIALDTFNMDPVIDKGTARDSHALKSLGQLTSVNINTLFQKLRDSKLDTGYWRSLTAKNSLKLDYKQFTIDEVCIPPKCVGISSVLLPLEETIIKPDFKEALQSYFQVTQSYRMTLFSMMTFVPGEAPYRQLLLSTQSSEFLQKLVHAILTLDASHSQQTSEDCLSLEVSELNPEAEAVVASLRLIGVHVAVFAQGNIKLSRKQLAPLLTTLCRQLEL